MPERLLVCGIGSGMDRSLSSIVRLGIEVFVVTDRATECARSAASATIIADPGDLQAVVAALDRPGARHFDGVMSLGFDNPPVIAGLCRIFDCPGLDEVAATECTLKDRRIEILAASGLKTPRYAVARNLDEALESIEEIGLPAVVKPVDLSDSRGVAKIETMDEAADLVGDALRLSRSRRVIVEQFLSGTEHTVAGLSVEGQFFPTGFSDRDYSRKEAFAPHFFERGDIMPTALDPTTVAAVLQTVERGVRALRLDPAVVNTDVLVTDDGDIIMLELTGRMTGARISTEIMHLSTGVNPLPNAIRLALGKPLDLSELTPTRCDAVVQRYEPSQGGVVEWVGDITEVARTLENVYDLFWGMELEPGQQLPIYASGRDVLAGVIAYGSTLAVASDAADRALASVPLRLRYVVPDSSAPA